MLTKKDLGRTTENVISQKITGKFYPFDQIPVCDSCWSLSAGPDGRIYAAACTELTGGVGAYIVRYDDKSDQLEYLVDVAEVVGDSADSGRATQCKIHGCFNPSPATGILYAATHLSGPALGELTYLPLTEWGDRRRAFRGSMLLAFDTKTDTVLWHDLLLPGEGARCTCLDEKRGLLYALSYPRDHLFVYDLSQRSLRDLGRLGSINSQVVFCDRHGRAYTVNDYGRMIRYDPDTDQLEELDVYLPTASYQTGWHAVIYDLVAAPSGDCFYGVSWCGHPHLFRFWPEDGEHGRIENLGPVTQDRDTTLPINKFLDHAGGMVFGPDGALYYVVSRWKPGAEAEPMGVLADGRDTPGGQGIVVRINIKTGEREDFAELIRPGHTAHYVSRGGIDRDGNLFFGNVGARPTGIFRLAMDDLPKGQAVKPPLRMWG